MTTTTNTNAYGATFLRITLGTLMLSHGLLKLYGFTIPGTVGYFASIGLPPIAAYLTIFGELAGGTAMILGVLTRLVALLNLPLLLGVVWAHSGNGWVFSNEHGGWEFPLFLVAIDIAVLIQGAGALSFGRVLAKFAKQPKLAHA